MLETIIVNAEKKAIAEKGKDSFDLLEKDDEDDSEKCRLLTTEYKKEFESALPSLVNLIDNAGIVDCFLLCREAERLVMIDLGN